MKLTAFSLSIVALCLSTQSYGNTVEIITVTGTRLAETSITAHSSISRETIERINPPNTVALLKQVPNLLISQNGGASGHSFASIRGGEANFILVMIDGVSVNDPTNSSGGGFDFNQLDPALIERVDVYRGGISAVYGGEAISGVIHFITRKTARSGVAAEIGTDAQRRVNLTLATPADGNYAALLSLSANNENPSDYSDYQNRQALLKLTADKTHSQHQLLFTASQTDKLAFAEDSGGSRFASPKSAEDRSSDQWLASWHSQYQPSNNQQWTTKASWSRHQEDITSPGIDGGVLSGIPPSDIASSYRKLEGEVYVNWHPSEDWLVLSGINAKRADGENAGVLDYGFLLPVDFKLLQESYGLFAEASKTLSAVSLNLGLRYDLPSGFDNEVSSRLSLAYQLTPQASLYASYSEGYKLPSFFALAHPLIGNLDLKPELSKNSEIGIRTQGEEGRHMQLNLFHNQFKDLVDFDSELFLSVNRSHVTTTGVEWRGGVNLTDWLSLSLDLTYLDVDMKGTDSKLRRRPSWFGGLQLNAELGDFDMTLFADSRSRFFDSSIGTGPVTLSGYTDIGFAAHWQVDSAIRLSLNLDNLMDKSFEQSVGFVDEGRRVRVGIGYLF